MTDPEIPQAVVEFLDPLVQIARLETWQAADDDRYVNIELFNAGEWNVELWGPKRLYQPFGMAQRGIARTLHEAMKLALDGFDRATWERKNVRPDG